MARRRLQLRYDKPLAPGDYVVTTGLLRDVRTSYGDEYELGVVCQRPEIFAYNPNYSHFEWGGNDVESVVIDYKQGMLASRAGEHVHFMHWLYKDFAEKTGIEVPCLLPKPDLYIDPARQQTPPISGRYWLLFGGGKTDFTVKHWDFYRYQQLSDALQERGISVVQTGAAGRGHVHPGIQRSLDLVGWGGLQDLFWKIYHADGVICPITMGMHAAAAFEKPCVVIAGGREEPWWEAYDNNWGQFGPRAEPVNVPHRYLHTLGQLNCCAVAGCWANKLQPTPDDGNACRQLAVRPANWQLLPECMQRITVDDVLSAVMGYYEDGTLPPLPETYVPSRLLDKTVSWDPAAMTAGQRGSRWQQARLGGQPLIVLHLAANLPEHQQLAMISMLLQTVPAAQRQILVAASQLSAAVEEQLLQLAPVARLAASDNVIMARSQVFNQLQTGANYVIWLGSGAVIKDPDWLNKVADAALRQVQPVGLLGTDDWFFAASACGLAEYSWDEPQLPDVVRGSSLPVVPINRGHCLLSYTGS